MATIVSAYNADGVLLQASGASKTGISGGKLAETLVGTAGNDSFRGGGGGDTLLGGKGDDIYNIYDSKDAAIENAAEGIDTVATTVTYRLGANIENLLLQGANITGIGNALNNIIAGGDGSQTLDGGAGNDVLTGGAGADVFVMSTGGGRDVIIDFQNGVDQVRLSGFGITSFDQVRSNLKQVGSDTLLSLAPGEQVLLRGHSVNDFSAKDFALSLDTSRLKLTFDDEFNGLSLYDSATGQGTWRTMLAANGIDGRTLKSNGEAEVYMDPGFAGTGKTPLGVNPFAINDGVLSITAAKASATVSAAINGYQYTSGVLTTKYTFAQQYGYFEMSAKLPAANGMWPAFWLLPADGTWPSELDILEQLGKDPGTAYMTSHSAAAGSHTYVQNNSVVYNSTTQFHTYGLMWDKDHLTYYIDGVQVAQQDTAADMHKPMYVLVNLAVGGQGSWAGAPDANFTSAKLDIDYIRAYALPDSGGVATPTVDPLYKGGASSGSSSQSSSSGSTSSGSTSGSTVVDTKPTVPVADTKTDSSNATTQPPANTDTKPPAADQGTLPKIIAGVAGVTDHHTIKASGLLVSNDAQVQVTKFNGAGGWLATDNDWISLTGFSKGSTFTWHHDDPNNSKIGYYTIHDAAYNRDYLVQIESVNGKHVATGDFAFY